MRQHSLGVALAKAPRYINGQRRGTEEGGFMLSYHTATGARTLDPPRRLQTLGQWLESTMACRSATETYPSSAMKAISENTRRKVLVPFGFLAPSFGGFPIRTCPKNTSPARCWKSCADAKPADGVSLSTRSRFGLPRARVEPMKKGHMRIVLVGDIHDQWNEVDEAALIALSPDIVLFVGDYGNENVSVVRKIAKYAESTLASVAAVTGNHDGFYSMSNTGRQNCPYDASKVDRVQEQLDLLSAINPAYRSIPVNKGGSFSIVGGRPFSWGGPFWKYNKFYRQYYQVFGLSQSSTLIAAAAVSAENKNIIFVSHQGPTGLGENENSPCGRDWGDEPGGDWGDADLRHGIKAARDAGKAVPLVVFGHMHSVLRGRDAGFRTMLHRERDGSTGHDTVMVNAAVVPRHKKHLSSPKGRSETLCQFTIVEIGLTGYVETAEQVWAAANGEIVEAKAMLDLNRNNAAATA